VTLRSTSKRYYGGRGGQKERSDATAAIIGIKNGEPVTNVHHPDRRAIVSGHAGSGDHPDNPESSESRVSYGAPVELLVISERYLGDESARLRFFARSPRGGQRSSLECRLGLPPGQELERITFTR
jgi:hypothetical protein